MENMDDLTRIGFEINREEGEEWDQLVIRYAKARNHELPCILEYKELVNEGSDEAVAALQALSRYGCVDLIIDEGHYKQAQEKDIH